MTRDLPAGGKRGQRIDQAKEVGLERGVAHGPVEHQPLPVGRLEKAGRVVVPEPPVHLATEALDVVFEKDVRCVGQVGQFRGEVHAEEKVGAFRERSKHYATARLSCVAGMRKMRRCFSLAVPRFDGG